LKELDHKVELDEENLSDAIHTMNADDFDLFIRHLMEIVNAPIKTNREIGDISRRVHARAISEMCQRQLLKLQPVKVIRESAA
jgi:hypothetical protein